MVSFRVGGECQRLLYVILFLGVGWQMPSSCSALPMFIRGRPRGGMLGSPLPVSSDDLSTWKLPPNMWLTQRLDHFHASDDRTWKQVDELGRFKTSRGGAVGHGRRQDFCCVGAAWWQI